MPCTDLSIEHIIVSRSYIFLSHMELTVSWGADEKSGSGQLQGSQCGDRSTGQATYPILGKEKGHHREYNVPFET